MNRRSRSRIIRGLVRLYPKAWRTEYGGELLSTLARLPLIPSVIFDVLRNATWQRLRYTAPWKLGGFALMLWMIFGTILNSIYPLSSSSHNRFCTLGPLVYLIVGYRSAKGSLRTASFAAGKAALIGILPEFLALMLYAIGAVHPTILDLDGSPSIVGSGFTDFCFRLAKGVPFRLPEKFIILPLVALPLAMFYGYIGAVASKTVSAFRGGMRRV